MQIINPGCACHLWSQCSWPVSLHLGLLRASQCCVRYRLSALPSCHCSSLLNFPYGTLREFCLKSALLKLEQLSCIYRSQLVSTVTWDGLRLQPFLSLPQLWAPSAVIRPRMWDFHSSLQFLLFSCPDFSPWEQTRWQKQAHSGSVDGTGMWMRCPFTSGPVLAFWAAQRSGMLLSSWLELGPEEISKLRGRWLRAA